LVVRQDNPGLLKKIAGRA
jgi:hypothetical protein